MTLLDKIPDSTWFFCFPMSLAVYLICALGIIHPLLWIKVWRVYRSELFMFMYTLVGFWSFLSCALLYAIIEESSCLYVFWIWYTMVFGGVMAGMMFLLFCGFCVLGMRRKSIAALLALTYYLVTIYFVVIVNKQRKEVFGLRANECNTCEERRALALTVKPEPKGAPRAATRAAAHGLRTSRLYTRPKTTATATTAFTTTRATTTTTTTTTTTEEPQRIVITPRTSTASTPDLRALRAMLSPYALHMSASTIAAEFITDQPTRTWPPPPRRDRDLAGALPPEPPQPPEPPEPPGRGPADPPKPNVDRGLDAIARLSDLLVHSAECRRPRRPAHGRFLPGVPRRAPAMTLTLRCDAGYRENSQVVTCKHNWWDRAIPSCRKRKPAPPLPLAGGGCELPGYPAHGEYTVAEHPRARPGDRVRGDNVVLVVTCDQPYRPVDAYVVCVEGRWRHGPPSCQMHCKLEPDQTVEYKCLKAFKDEFTACSAWQPDGTLVLPACKPAHAHRGPFRHMRCRGDSWDHVVTCQPNANFTT